MTPAPSAGPAPRTRGPVRVVGTGLLGTSIGIALSTRGVDVVLADPSPSALALACDLGAGRTWAQDDEEPALVVVAAPPDVTGEVVALELATWPRAVVTDVASVKAGPLA
ncbi:MAG: prephenate dehydrogenase/arogenate dehydrogenase family protein, partial [Actinomycetota bacterium]